MTFFNFVIDLHTQFVGSFLEEETSLFLNCNPVLQNKKQKTYRNNEKPNQKLKFLRERGKNSIFIKLMISEIIVFWRSKSVRSKLSEFITRYFVS